MATQKEVGDHLGITQQAVSQIVAAGILKPEPGKATLSVNRCRGAYIAHLREQAAGRAGRAGAALDLSTERARLAASQAEAQERKNARDRGELVSLPETSAAVAAVFAKVKSRLGLVGGRVAIGNHKLRAKIDAAINDALAELSKMNVVHSGDASATPPDDTDE